MKVCCGILLNELNDEITLSPNDCFVTREKTIFSVDFRVNRGITMHELN